jgi:hypothetical protein
MGIRAGSMGMLWSCKRDDEAIGEWEFERVCVLTGRTENVRLELPGWHFEISYNVICNTKTSHMWKASDMGAFGPCCRLSCMFWKAEGRGGAARTAVST